MADSPTQRTLKALRDAGWIAGVVEYWQPSFASHGVIEAASNPESTLADIRDKVADLQKYGPGKRQDLYDFVDIVAVGRGYPKFIQCTASSGMSARVNKIVLYCNEAAQACLRSRVHIEVWGWKRYAKAINRKHWRPTIKRLKFASNGAISAHTIKDGSQKEPESLPF